MNATQLQYFEISGGVDANPISAILNFQDRFVNHTNPANASQIEQLTIAECITAYGSDFVTGRGDVVLITDHAQGYQNLSATPA